MTNTWYDIREVLTGLSGGLYYSGSLDSSEDRDDAIRRGREFLREFAEGFIDVGTEGYDRVSIEVWEMAGDDELRRIWCEHHDFDDFDID